MNTYDFGRSFLRWTSTGVNHTPRLQVEAVCRWTHEGRTSQFYLGAACAGETMYAERDLIQQPSYDFMMIYGQDGQFAFLKLYADEGRNVIEAHRVGETMSTWDGKGVGIREMSVSMVSCAKARELTTHPEVCDAILADKPLNARTEYLAEDGESRIILDYPVKVCNTTVARTRWQVDTGPVLIPDLTCLRDVPVLRLRTGYVVFNDWQWAEVGLRRIGPGRGPEEPSGFLPSRRLSARNSLYLVE